MDVGAGGGVPGLVLAIAAPGREVVLVESVGKKAAFLTDAVRALGLAGQVRVLCERAEATGRGPLRERAGAALARALGPLATCLELTLPLVAPGGRVLLYRGPTCAEEERAVAQRVAPRLGGGEPRWVDARLPDGAARRLAVVPKVAATSANYPRRVGVPAKRPLS